MFSPSSDDPIAIVMRRDFIREIKRCVNRLHPHYRRALELRFLDENDNATSAFEMGISTASFKSILFRAKAALIYELAPYFWENATPWWNS